MAIRYCREDLSPELQTAVGEGAIAVALVHQVLRE